jgi:hypothetical protein
MMEDDLEDFLYDLCDDGYRQGLDHPYYLQTTNMFCCEISNNKEELLALAKQRNLELIVREERRLTEKYNERMAKLAKLRGKVNEQV